MARYALVIAALAGLLLTAGFTNLLYPILEKIRFAQPAKRITGPAAHKAKAGTPTMGGIGILLGSGCASLLAVLGLNYMDNDLLVSQQKMNLMLAVACALAFGVIGFAEDWLKVVLQRRRGLRTWQHILLELVATAILLVGLSFNGMLETGMIVPGFGYVELGNAYYPLAVLLILAVLHSVHITDGIDGLCGGTAFAAMLGYVVICGFLNALQLSVFAAALAGALVAFLWWNIYPAKLFMGDTGSMFVGGALVSIGFCMGWPSLLVLLAGIYLLEGLSVLLQVVYFRLSKGKLLFKMAPLHASLELSGWSENKITLAFSAAAGVLMLLALLLAYLN